ncbi:MAG: histidine phosphatase family protein [Caulobacteraceae bacterium]|nr:histidine phosphatase family protein [Caulobacter sp.]
MRLYLARHAETVFNAGARMQGAIAHTPLTRAGFRQAEAMGEALAGAVPPGAELELWASPAGRTVQTAAILAEHLRRDPFEVRTDARLLEIGVGAWEGRTYAEIAAAHGPVVDRARGLFSVQAPGGEWYPAIAERLRGWLADLDPARDVLAVSHGVTSRVLRGLLAGGPDYEGVPVGDAVPQGSVVLIEHGRETVLHVGAGDLHGRAM